jgi:hypothetical protein
MANNPRNADRHVPHPASDADTETDELATPNSPTLTNDHYPN